MIISRNPLGTTRIDRAHSHLSFRFTSEEEDELYLYFNFLKCFRNSNKACKHPEKAGECYEAYRKYYSENPKIGVSVFIESWLWAQRQTAVLKET